MTKTTVFPGEGPKMGAFLYCSDILIINTYYSCNKFLRLEYLSSKILRDFIIFFIFLY
jgi:hypothetical protein